MNKKRILSVTIKRMIDDSPDTSWLGEYASRPTSEFSIDRAHSEDCIENDSIQKDKLERIADYLESLQSECDCLDRSWYGETHDTACPLWLEDSLQESHDTVRELSECDCGERGDMGRHEYRYFNPSFNYVDKNGHALPENTSEEVRKYVRQDYECMESLNAGHWCFIGIQAESSVVLLGVKPDGRFEHGSVVQRIHSGGLWGIESDSDKSYIEEIESEQLSELRTELKALGFSSRAISTAFKTIERKDS